MKKIYLLLALCLMNFSYGQDYKSGENFDFDEKNETDPQFVLADNYNTFLVSV